MPMLKEPAVTCTEETVDAPIWELDEGTPAKGTDITVGNKFIALDDDDEKLPAGSEMGAFLTVPLL